MSRKDQFEKDLSTKLEILIKAMDEGPQALADKLARYSTPQLQFLILTCHAVRNSTPKLDKLRGELEKAFHAR